jgi:hypothetical protein
MRLCQLGLTVKIAIWPIRDLVAELLVHPGVNPVHGPFAATKMAKFLVVMAVFVIHVCFDSLLLSWGLRKAYSPVMCLCQAGWPVQIAIWHISDLVAELLIDLGVTLVH